jgi:hypothetical protein
MNLELIQLNSYTRPVIKELTTKEYVTNGDRNSFYQYLIDRYNGSPTNRTIIDSYSKFIYGKGLFSKEQTVKAHDFANILQILKKNDLKNICQDYVLFGEASMELIYEKGKLIKIKHVPKNQILPNKMNEDGDIELYWFSQDFNNTRKYPPREIENFHFKKQGTKNAIYVITSYQAGRTYFADPSYMAGLPYAELEEEIANYCVNHIKNGLSFGYIINMNNGEPQSEELKERLEEKFKNFGTGSKNAGRGMINWNDSKENDITLTSVEVSESHKQYEFLSGEATQKLMIAHKVTSPIIFGIMKEGGLGNNANEMETAFNQLYINVIQPIQENILDSLKEVFTDNGMTIDLDFIPLNGIPKTEVTQLCKHETQLSEKVEEVNGEVAEFLLSKGEDIDLNEYEIIDTEDFSESLVELSDFTLNTSLKLATVPSSFPNVKSELDNDVFKVRFNYAGTMPGSQTPQRDFCRKMLSAQKVYRKEDIVLAGNKKVNPGWGAGGTDTYDILKYKGGGNCKHKWVRSIYLRKNNESITFENAKKMIKDLKDLGIDAKIENSGEPLSSIEPNKMPNNGFIKKK